MDGGTFGIKSYDLTGLESASQLCTCALRSNGSDKKGIVWRGREPGDLVPYKVPRSTRLKFQHHGHELGLHAKKSSREKKSTLYGALSKLDKICGVK
jgi:hypothetical protein